jgi:predicted DNA-binding transcriptional regulator YafY/glutathione S-transferase
VSGAELAREAGVSLRTLYRDIATLQAMGAGIDGEPGVGYVLRPGFLMPPLMFSEEEIEALALGARWVMRRTDPELAAAARNAMAKIAAVLPDDLKRRLDDEALVVAPGVERRCVVDLKVLRRALRQERKLAIGYCDVKGTRTERIIWPTALGFCESTRILVAWCELRQGFRHFRADRIETAQVLDARLPRRRKALEKQWRENMLTETVSGVRYQSRSSNGTKGDVMTRDAATNDLILYTHPRSRGSIVHWMLEEIGVPYTIEIKEFGATMKEPAYLAINPMGKVPALRHGDTVVTESAAICAYLADAFPEAGLAPERSARGSYYRWLFFGAGCLEPALINHSVGWDPATPEMQARFGYGSYAKVLDTLAQAVAGRRYIAGDAFTAADILIGSAIRWSTMFGLMEQRPEFEAYWNGLKDRPARLRAQAQADQLLAPRG